MPFLGFKKILRKAKRFLFLINFRSRKLQVGLLLALVVGLLIPRPAYALVGTALTILGVGGVLAAIAFYMPSLIIGAASALFYALKFPAEWILDLGAKILTAVLTNFFNEGLFQAPFVREAWGFTRDLANMFFILWLVIIALATILDIRGWQAKKLLPKLIIIALLVNFSLVISWFLLDLGSATIAFFANVKCKGGPSGTVAPSPQCLRTVIGESEMFEFHSPSGMLTAGTDEAAAHLADNFLGVIFLGAAGIAFFLLAVMMLVRMVAIWFLLIMAPLAWVYGIMPFGARWLKKWWSEFFKWTFYGVVVAFFLYVVTGVVRALRLSGGWGARFSSIKLGGGPAGTQMSFFNNLANVMQYLTVLIFLVMAVKLARSTAAGAGDFVTTGVARWGQAAGRKVGRGVTYPGRRGWQRTQIGTARTAEQGLKRIEGVPVVGAAAGRMRTGISQWRGKKEAEHYKGERRRISNLTRDEIMDLAKDGNIEARRIAALRHWTKNKAELPDKEARDWYKSLSSYPDVQETLGEDRPEAAGKKVPAPKIDFFDVGVNGGNWGKDADLTPNDKLGIRWEVGGKRVHTVDIQVSGDNREVPGVEKMDNQNRKDKIDPLIEYDFTLGASKTVYYKLVAKTRRGGRDTSVCTVRFHI